MHIDKYSQEPKDIRQSLLAANRSYLKAEADFQNKHNKLPGDATDEMKKTEEYIKLRNIFAEIQSYHEKLKYIG